MRNYAPYHLLWTFSLALLFSFQFARKDLTRAFEAFQQKDFTTAERLFNKVLLDNPDDARAFLGLSSVYAHPDFTHRSPQRAFEYLLSAEKRLGLLREKELAFLEKYGLTSQSIADLKVRLGTEIVQEAFSNRSIEGLESAMQQFAGLPEVAQLARERRNELAFAEAEKINTYQAYQNFTAKYPDAKQVPEAAERYDSLLYRSFARMGTQVAFERFMQSYPDSPYYGQARQEYEKLVYDEATRENTIEAYSAFVRDNPTSPYVEKAQAQLVRFAMRLPVRIGNRWGFINGKGQLVISPAFEKAGSFVNGYARVRQNGKWGYVDNKGKLVIKAVFDGAKDFSGGLAAVITRKKGPKSLYEAFYIDTTGRSAFDKVYETTGFRMPIHSFSDGLGAVIDPKTEKVGFINKAGDFVIAPLFTPVIGQENASFDYAFSNFSNGFAWVKDSAEEGLIDHKGVFLISGKYTQPYLDTLSGPRYRQSFSNGLCLVQDITSSVNFYIDSSGKKIISLPKGVTGFSFSDEVAWLQLPVAQRYQLMDTTGMLLADVQAIRVRPFSEGLAVVQQEAPSKRVFFYDEIPEGSYVYIDKKGKQRFEYKFHVLADPAYSFLNGEFHEGIAGILLDGRQTYIDNEGNIIWQSKEAW